MKGNEKLSPDEDEGIPMILVLNKFDLVEDLVEQGHQLEEFMTQEYLQEFAEENGFIGAVCTSAKTGVGVIEAVSNLVRQILMNELNIQNRCNECQENKGIEDDLYGGRSSLK